MPLKRFVTLSFAMLLALLVSCSSEVALTSQLTDPSPAVVQLSASASSSFSFTNQSKAEVTVSLNSTVSWVSVLPRTSTLAPGATLTAGVSADCTGQASSRASITIKTNEPGAVTKVVGVNLSCPTSEPEVVGAAGYDIDVQFSGSDFTPERKAVFLRAAARWSSLISTDLPMVAISKSENSCGPAFSGNVDDLLIFAVVRPIDGPGNVLGQAGPCYTRATDGRLPVVGIMEFDSADVADLEAEGQFETVILHEMGHVLGIGTLWDIKSLEHGHLDYDGDGTDCSSSKTFSTKPSFNGAAATREYAALGGKGQAPVEDGYGPGTKCGHWDEELFAEELMTGFLDAGAVPLSRLTIASLADIGYSVNYDAAEDYALRGCAPDCLLPQTLGERINEVLLSPLAAISPEGVVLEGTLE